MISYCLKSPDESIAQIAQVFASGDCKAQIEVHEDKCFKAGTWLRVGTISMHPGGSEPEDADAPIEQAIRYGSYGWKLPSFDALTTQMKTVYQEGKKRNNDQQKLKHDDKTRRALEALVHCASRCGFVNPTFDAGSVAEMPFARPTTVVVDTSAVLQGGLDFVIRFLYPMARIKIPAIVHMEILTMADRYFTHRRVAETDIHPAAVLLDHVTSQGAQRVLLRLELQTEAEIERPRLGADPLRGVVQPDNDAEDKSLNLQIVQRSFADRLILETAIQHRDRLSPDHPIMVLTADQGLARMTLGEGLHALFFSSPPVEQVCGRTLSGTGFRPFVDDMGEASLFYIPLPALLWELACTFGCARLVTEDGSTGLTVSAIGHNLSWHPFHSRDDLLWTLENKPSADAATTTTQVTPGNTVTPDRPKDTPVKHGRSDMRTASKPSAEPLNDQSPRNKSPGGLTGSYRFPVKSMLQLVLGFEREERIADRDGMRLVGVKTASRYREFRNFLLAGQFAERINGGLVKQPPMDALIQAIKVRDLQHLREMFSLVPSFAAFLSCLAVGRPVAPNSIQSIGREAAPTYISLSEVCCAALDIPDEGIYLTPHSPVPSDFAPMALGAYRRLKGGEDYVLTGRWLEELARHDGVHPVRARERLNEAREAGLLERYTEGSTPETQYERHNMAILELNKGVPTIRKLNLYHGDFLIPEKASVSIRLAEQKDEPAG